MMMFLAKILIGFSLAGIASSCSCARPVHRQEQFCAVHYAILARVVSINDSSNEPWAERKLNVEIIKVFHGPQYLYFGKQVPIYTIASEALCGVSAGVNQFWFFTGGISNFKLSASFCGWNDPWILLSNCERTHLISDSYKNNCQCKVKKCTPDKDCNTTSMECPLYPGQSTRKDGFCGINEGECKWYRCILQSRS